MKKHKFDDLPQLQGIKPFDTYINPFRTGDVISFENYANGRILCNTENALQFVNPSEVLDRAHTLKESAKFVLKPKNNSDNWLYITNISGKRYFSIQNNRLCLNPAKSLLRGSLFEFAPHDPSTRCGYEVGEFFIQVKNGRYEENYNRIRQDEKGLYVAHKDPLGPVVLLQINVLDHKKLEVQTEANVNQCEKLEAELLVTTIIGLASCTGVIPALIDDGEIEPGIGAILLAIVRQRPAMRVAMNRLIAAIINADGLDIAATVAGVVLAVGHILTLIHAEGKLKEFLELLWDCVKLLVSLIILPMTLSKFVVFVLELINPELGGDELIVANIVVAYPLMVKKLIPLALKTSKSCKHVKAN